MFTLLTAACLQGGPYIGICYSYIRKGNQTFWLWRHFWVHICATWCVSRCVFVQTESCLQGSVARSTVLVWLCDHIPGQARSFIQGVLFNTKYFSCISLSCSQSLSQSAPESLARQCLASQGLVFSWHCWRKVCSFQSENRYSCCGCVCLLPTLLCACHCRCRADSGPNSHQALGPPGAGVWRDLLSCAFSVCSQPSKQDSWISQLCCKNT